MLRLKLQYFGHLMRRASSLERTLMGEWQRMRWLNGIISAKDMNLGKLQEMMRDTEAWHAIIHAVAKGGTWLYNWTTIWSCAVLCLVAQSCLTLCDPMNCSPPGTSVYGDSTGKNTRVACHALLKGIIPTQGSNPGLLHCRQSLSEPPGKTKSTPRALPHPGIELRSSALQADSLTTELLGKPAFREFNLRR